MSELDLDELQQIVDDMAAHSWTATFTGKAGEEAHAALVVAAVNALPALLARLSALTAAARAVVALDINTEYLGAERSCRHCDQWLNHGTHDPGCPVGMLVALLPAEEGTHDANV